MNPRPAPHTGLHDPALDIGRAVNPSRFVLDMRMLGVLLAIALLIASLIRLRRTDEDDPEQPARADMARLMGVVVGGLIVEWVRSRFDLATPGFWAASIVLLPFVLAACFLISRLFVAYRHSRSVS